MEVIVGFGIMFVAHVLAEVGIQCIQIFSFADPLVQFFHCKGVPQIMDSWPGGAGINTQTIPENMKPRALDAFSKERALPIWEKGYPLWDEFIYFGIVLTKCDSQVVAHKDCS